MWERFTSSFHKSSIQISFELCYQRNERFLWIMWNGKWRGQVKSVSMVCGHQGKSRYRHTCISYRNSSWKFWHRCKMILHNNRKKLLLVSRPSAFTLFKQYKKSCFHYIQPSYKAKNLLCYAACIVKALFGAFIKE